MEEPAAAAVDGAQRCANCRIPIEAEPVMRDGKPYCCDGCGDGGPCSC